MTAATPQVETLLAFERPSDVRRTVPTPYHHLVPKDLDDNLKWRLELLRYGQSSKRAADELWMMCSRDPLFWVDSFVWTFNPRLSKGQRKQPWISYPFQENAILTIIAASGSIDGCDPFDCLFEKSRDMGATWLAIICDAYQSSFEEFFSALWVSRKEDLVDKADDPKSMFWKLDFLIEHLPPFLSDRFERKKLHYKNFVTDSTIDGESTTGDLATGDRRSRITLDEFAKFERAKPGMGMRALSSTADATDCRLFNSTHDGTGTAFYMMAKSDVHKIQFHWSAHLVKGAGLYSVNENGTVNVIDGEYHERRPGYEFIHKAGGFKGLRSPWYDRECRRRKSKLEVAQELDMDAHASGGQFYDKDTIEVIETGPTRTLLAPVVRGNVSFDPLTGTFRGFNENPHTGTLKLWMHPDAIKRKRAGVRYVIGVDVAGGSDASNACLCVADATTGEQVAEFADIETTPDKLAKIAMAVGLWFKVGTTLPELIWERNGPGSAFGLCIRDLGYDSFYHRSDADTGVRDPKPGWPSAPQNNLDLMGLFRRSLSSGSFVIRSDQALEELKAYVYTKTGGVAHQASLSIEDPSGAKRNHGDRARAAALACLCMGLEPSLDEDDKVPDEIPDNCFFARRQAFRRRKMMDATR